MASWLKSFFGGSDEITDLPEDLQKMLAQAKRDRRALRDLLRRSEKAQQTLLEGSGPLAAVQAGAEAMSKQMTDLQARADSFDGLSAQSDSVSAQLDSVEKRAKELAEAQKRSDATLTDTSRGVGELKTQVREIRSMADEAVVAKEEISDLAGPYGTVASLLQRVNQLRQEVEQMQERATGLEKSASHLDVVERRIKEIGESQTQLAGSLERSSGSADKLDGQVTALHKQV